MVSADGQMEALPSAALSETLAVALRIFRLIWTLGTNWSSAKKNIIKQQLQISVISVLLSRLSRLSTCHASSGDRSLFRIEA